jgi:catechol 2,3-dioxygenase-like lactoylglutathione lyase family enzyme
MPVSALQHINIRSRDVERSRDFYERIVGLRTGDRPPIASIGYWLYLGSQPVIHLVHDRDGHSVEGAATGAIDHIAFQGVDLEGTRAALRRANIPFREAIVPRDGTLQLFVHDPDGIKIEMNFAA